MQRKNNQGRTGLENRLVQSGLDDRELAQLNDVDVTDEIIKIFLSKLENPDIVNPLRRIKTARDKAIAHQEAVEISELPTHTYAEMDSLINFAKDFLSVVGFGYIGSSPALVTSDAKRSSSALRRLLEEAKII